MRVYIGVILIIKCDAIHQEKITKYCSSGILHCSMAKILHWSLLIILPGITHLNFIVQIVEDFFVTIVVPRIIPSSIWIIIL